jgi:hypothetical protein
MLSVSKMTSDYLKLCHITANECAAFEATNLWLVPWYPYFLFCIFHNTHKAEHTCMRNLALFDGMKYQKRQPAALGN